MYTRVIINQLTLLDELCTTLSYYLNSCLPFEAFVIELEVRVTACYQ